jgi:hypothetical protein
MFQNVLVIVIDCLLRDWDNGKGIQFHLKILSSKSIRVGGK